MSMCCFIMYGFAVKRLMGRAGAATSGGGDQGRSWTDQRLPVAE